MDPMTMMMLAQMGLGIAGGISGKKAAKKARKEQKRLVAKRMKVLNELGAQYQAGGQFYESAQKGLRTRQDRDISDIVAQRTRSFTKVTSAGTEREKYMARTGRQQAGTLESWLQDKYAGVQRARADALGEINIKGPSAGSIENAFAQAGQGLSSIMSWSANKNQPDADAMGSDITQQPQATLSAGPSNPLSGKPMYRNRQGLRPMY